MLISHRVLPVVIGLGLGLTSAYALDGRKSPDSLGEIPGVGAVMKPQPPSDPSHMTEFVGANIAGALKQREDAYNKGDPVAGWQLGRMYADGLSVEHDPKRAFQYFKGVYDWTTSSAHEDERRVPEVARALADASVQLGLYYLKGIPNSEVKADPTAAFEYFRFAATYLSDPYAQFYLGRLYQDGQGCAKDPKSALKWFNLAANQGHYDAQARYGIMLVEGKGISRDVGQGLSWLRAALDTAPEGDSKEAIRAVYGAAMDQATKDERATAEVFYEQRQKRRKPAGAKL